MKPSFTLSFALLSLSATIYTAQAQPVSDADYKEKILGQWKQEIVQGPATLKGLETFKRGGTVIADGMLTLRGQKTPIKVSGVWEIKNGVLIATVKKTNVPQMLPVDQVSKDKIVEINETVFRYKTEDGKLEWKTRVRNLRNLNNTDEKKVPGIKPETIEVEIIKGLSASIKVSNGIEKIQDPALSKCFASPFYLAEIEIGELVWKQKVSFARTNKGMVMIPKHGTEKKLSELLGLLNPEFTLKTEEDGQAMLSALKAIYPSYVDDDFTPRMEKRENQWVFIFDKFFKKLSGIAVVTDDQGRILRIARSLSIDP